VKNHSSVPPNQTLFFVSINLDQDLDHVGDFIIPVFAFSSALCLITQLVSSTILPFKVFIASFYRSPLSVVGSYL